jgi:hypothetical protein
MCLSPSHHYCAPVGDSRKRCHMTTPLPNNAVRRCQPPSFFHFRKSLLARERANVPQRYSVLLTARTRPLDASPRPRRPRRPRLGGVGALRKLRASYSEPEWECIARGLVRIKTPQFSPRLLTRPSSLPPPSYRQPSHYPHSSTLHRHEVLLHRLCRSCRLHRLRRPCRRPGLEHGSEGYQDAHPGVLGREYDGVENHRCQLRHSSPGKCLFIAASTTRR